MENKDENNDKVKISEIGKVFVEPSEEEPSQIEEIRKSPDASDEQKEAMVSALKRVDKDILLKTTGGEAFEKRKNKNIKEDVKEKAKSRSPKTETIQQVDAKQVEHEDKEIG